MAAFDPLRTFASAAQLRELPRGEWMKIRSGPIFFIAIAGFIAMGSAANAEDLCRARALRDVSPVGGGSYVIPKGGYVTAITQYEVDDLGRGMFCSHGGGCYPEYVTVEGQGRVRALEMTNCKIVRRHDPKLGYNYSVEIDRSRNSAADLRFNDIEDQLISIGIYGAGADNAARHYVQNPSGACGKLVRRVLEGNPEARRRVLDTNICFYDYGARR